MSARTPLPTASRELTLHSQGFLRVAGVDEAGAGAWAGPVVAGAVLFLPEHTSIPVRDSKQLTEPQREELYETLLRAGVVCAPGIASAAEIDHLSIRQAVFLAMRRALAGIEPVSYVLVDGYRVGGHHGPQTAIIRGDQEVWSIAAASIVAKVTRDRMMRDFDIQFPEYGFADHKGYGTAHHQSALKEHGVLSIHRQSYAPIRALTSRTTE